MRPDATGRPPQRPPEPEGPNPPDSGRPTLPESAGELETARILIVDDTPATARLLERMLQRGGFEHVKSTTNPLDVEALYDAFAPDLILLDLHMPELDGFGVMQRLAQRGDGTVDVPIIMLTADATTEAKQRALAGGANDFLLKPLDHVEVLLRIRNLLETRMLHLQLREHNRTLEQRVRARTRALDAARLEVLHRLGRAAEYRDDETGQHTRRVGHLAGLLAEHLELPADDVERIRQAAPLHDLGKIGISDTILLKPGPLTDEELQTMRTHTAIGAGILAGSGIPLLTLARDIARRHHERWDGTGYPDGLAGDEIPLAARIVAVADVFDALSHDRPYRAAWAIDDVIAYMRSESGRHFDPDVIRAFERVEPQARRVAATV